MSGRIETTLSEALLAQRAALRRLGTSAALDARFEQSLATWSSERLRARRRHRLSWAFAAAAAAVVLMSTGWLVMHVDASRSPAGTHNVGAVQIADADATVLRVRASLGTQLPLRSGNGFYPRRRHYWIDVAVAPDGTLYVERVTPIDEDPQLFVP